MSNNNLSPDSSDNDEFRGGDKVDLFSTQTRLTNGAKEQHPQPSETEHQVTFPPTQQSRIIGNYKLLQLIGEGGMGQVWMADQMQPVKRRVAVKLIKPGKDSKPIVARFEAERQALALMDHLSIASILDGGTTETGEPYFVMELVQGLPITQYCDKHKLNIRKRLDLFIQVCNAVQHAHQKGIIHRDLKPSNILVSLYDGNPIPKVIDFGLAKALDQRSKLTDKTLFTEFGAVVGTLQYMSPEQAELDALDIDTRADIYALGVLLYELLTGSTPIESDTLKEQAILLVLQSIREKDPPRPSDRLSSTGHQIADIGMRRQIAPANLQRELRGDLDWVVMKAIEKDRSRRYETASGFAADIDRYLTNQPVIARPPSTAYRLRKFVRKNRGIVLSLVSFASLLLLGILGTASFAWKAKTAENVALFARSKEATANRELTTAYARQNKALAIAMDSVDSVLIKYSVDPRVAREGFADSQLSAIKLASTQYEKLLLVFEGQPKLIRETERAMRILSIASSGFGKVDEAISYSQKADAMWPIIGSSDDADLLTQAQLKRFIGYCLFQRNDRQASEAYHGRGLELLNSISSLGEFQLRVQLEKAVALTYLGEAQLLETDDKSTPEVALKTFSEAEHLFTQIDERDYPDLASSDDPEPVVYYRAMNLFNLAGCESQLGFQEQALARIGLSRELLNSLATRHPDHATYRSRQLRALLNYIFIQQGKLDVSTFKQLMREAKELGLVLWKKFPFNSAIRSATASTLRVVLMNHLAQDENERREMLLTYAEILAKYTMEDRGSSGDAQEIALCLSTFPSILIGAFESASELPAEKQLLFAMTLAEVLKTLTRVRFTDEAKNKSFLPKLAALEKQIRTKLQAFDSSKPLDAFDHSLATSGRPLTDR